MENNEQNNVAATNNVNSVNNVQPTPVVNPTPEVKTENTIMVAEPAATPAVESTPVAPTPAPVAPTPAQPAVAPVAPAPVAEPVVTKTKSNNGIIAFLVIIILVLLGACGYFVYDKYFANKPSTPSTNNQTNNQSTNKVDPTPTPDVVPDDTTADEDVAIDANLAVKNLKNASVDSKTTEYTYDIYLGDKLVVGNLTYSMIGVSANDANITLTKVGYLKDTVTNAKYYAFSVKKAPVAMSGNYLFIIDKDGNVVFRREGSTNGTTYIKELDEYVTGTSYKIDETENKLLYYVENGNSSSEDFKLEVKSVQISSGSSVDTLFKTYTKSDVN